MAIETGKMVILKDGNNENIFPKSSSQAIYMSDGRTLESLTDEGVFFEENSDIIELNKPEMVKKINTMENDLISVNSQLEQKAKQKDVDVLKERMDTFTTLPEGSTTGDAELIDGRIAFDGKKYDNLGNAIREQNKYIE